MRILRTNAAHRSHRESGFSLIEVLTVIAIGIIATAITFISMIPVLKQARLDNAYNTTMAAMRQARDNAISQRTSYSVTFTTTTSPAANTITVAPTLTSFQGVQTAVTYKLPNDVAF